VSFPNAGAAQPSRTRAILRPMSEVQGYDHASNGAEYLRCLEELERSWKPRFLKVSREMLKPSRRSLLESADRAEAGSNLLSMLGPPSSAVREHDAYVAALDECASTARAVAAMRRTLTRRPLSGRQMLRRLRDSGCLDRLANTRTALFASLRREVPPA
jgi:hypothetical protein